VYLKFKEKREREKVSKKPLVKNDARIKILQEFQDNSSQDCEQKQGQLKKVCNSQSESIVNKKHEKQHEIDHIKQKK